MIGRILKSLLLSAVFLASTTSQAAGQEGISDELAQLEEARVALAEMPGDKKTKDTFLLALHAAAEAEQKAGRIEEALSLNAELLAALDLRLRADPTSRKARWQRYYALRVRYVLIGAGNGNSEPLEDLAARAEVDIRALNKTYPEVQQYRHELITTIGIVAWHYRQGSDLERADTLSLEGVELARDILAKTPNHIPSASALAAGLAWRASRRKAADKSYEALEAAIPMFEEAILAFKDLAEISNTAEVHFPRAQSWLQLSEVYLELGDDFQAAKAARAGFHVYEKARLLAPSDVEIERHYYRLAYYVAGRTPDREKKAQWLGKAKELIEEAKRDGNFDPADAELASYVDKQLDASR